MADYRKMYDLLFNNVTDAILLLQRAQQKTEEIFISSDNESLEILSRQI